MQKKQVFKTLIVAPATSVMLASGATAGGLADTIVEAPPAEIAPVAEPSSSNSWVVPALALLLLGVAVAANADDDDDDGGDDPMQTTFSSMF